MKRPKGKMNFGQRVMVLAFALFVILAFVAGMFFVGYLVGKVFL
jgi:hypothetical protein